MRIASYKVYSEGRTYATLYAFLFFLHSFLNLFSYSVKLSTLNDEKETLGYPANDTLRVLNIRKQLPNRFKKPVWTAS